MFRVIYFFSVLVLFITFLIGLFTLIRAIIHKICHKKDGNKKNSLTKDFERFAIRTKWKRWGITASIPVLILSVFYFLAYNINSNAMSNAYQKTVNEANAYLETQAVNIDGNNMIINNYGTFSSNIHVDSYKNIDGYRVPWQSLDFSFGTLDSDYSYDYKSASPVQDRNAYYTQDTNQKIATFFLPKLNYKSKDYIGLQPTHEATGLQTMTGQLAEVAVSFDKPYTYSEIQKMISKNLLINWYWLGLNDDKTMDLETTNYFGLESNNLDSEGLKSNHSNGKLSTNSYKYFVEQLKIDIKGNSSMINNFSSAKDALKQVKKYPTLDKAKFSGVILTGRTENFASLDSEKWVFATNVGVTTPINSYTKPIK